MIKESNLRDKQILFYTSFYKIYLFSKFKHGLKRYPWGSKETMLIILLVQISIAQQLEDYDFEI